MKKLERLAWIERTFGRDVVSPYEACYDWADIYSSIQNSWLRGSRPSIRTDWVAGATQGFNLPFVHLIDDEAALERGREVWNKYGTALVYIVVDAVQPVICNGVAERLDDEHIFVEINDKEPDSTQRHMYKHPENLRQFTIGPSSGYIMEGILRPCYKPEWCGVYSLDRIYAAMYQGGAQELTFSIRANRGVVIW